MRRTYQLQLTDFQSQATQIGTEVNITSIHTASSLDFGFMMNDVASQFKSKLLSPARCCVFNRSRHH